MNLKQQFILIGSILALAFCVWVAPVQASEPEVLIDVVEIVDPAPFIIHTNILPGDSFLHPMTVRNLTGSPQDVGMKLYIDSSQGIVNIIPYELEEQIFVKIEREGSGFIELPGGGQERTLQELHNTLIELGNIPGASTQVYNISFVFNKDAGNKYQNTKVYFNVTMGLEVPDVLASLQIFKENDSVGDEAPGNEVKYTLRVTALNGNVNNVELTDLPPLGFVFVPGSATGAPFIHQYASPGVWDLGNIAEGETKTITYKAKISDIQDNGLYRDLAWAKGIAGNEDAIFAIDPSDSDSFVGTRVAVATPTSEQVALNEKTKTDTTTKHKTIRVLGASIALPATGSGTWWIILAGFLAVIGGGLILLGKRKRIQANSSIKNIMKLFILALLGLGIFGFSETARAATIADDHLSVQIETPDSPQFSSDFQIGFVALNIDAINQVLVKCFRDAEATPFNTFTLATGGSSGNCNVADSGITADGNYNFYVTAEAISGQVNQTDPVSVDVDVSAPGTPLNYDRSGCTVNFTTANDGETSAVELYRSTSLNFTADASTFVASINIAPNTAGSIVDPNANCGGDFFYAIRAIDAFGNGSGFVGDENINVDHVTRTRTTTRTIHPVVQATGAIPVAGGGAVAGEQTGQEQGQGQVEGESNQQGQIGNGEAGQVAGAENWQTKLKNNWPWIVLALIVLGVLYKAYKKRVKKNINLPK